MLAVPAMSSVITNLWTENFRNQLQCMKRNKLCAKSPTVIFQIHRDRPKGMVNLMACVHLITTCYRASDTIFNNYLLYPGFDILPIQINIRGNMGGIFATLYAATRIYFSPIG